MDVPLAEHLHLPCGVELAALPLPDRRTVSAHIRFLAGFAHEPPDKLGLNHVVEQTISKGTQRRDGQELSDAFDAMGVKWTSWAGRESVGYQLTCLPEFLDAALDLHVEFLRTPTFPDEFVKVTIENLNQEIANLADDPHDLSAKLFNRQVYGPVLGRHVLGEPQTLETITGADLRSHWERYYQAGAMQVAVAGPIDTARLTDDVQSRFTGFGSGEAQGREPFSFDFKAATVHHPKELEQNHIGICYPGAPVEHDLFYAQRVAMGVLSGGMSARLFTEVREKQGLVYWVTAHTEHPRGIGIVYLGASTKPERCDQTYQTLLRELDRLSEDLSEEELHRAVTGIVSRVQTRGDITRARCGEVAEDLFHHGRVIPLEEKLNKVRAVTVADVHTYLKSFPREHLSVMTLGPRKLEF